MFLRSVTVEKVRHLFFTRKLTGWTFQMALECIANQQRPFICERSKSSAILAVEEPLQWKALSRALAMERDLFHKQVDKLLVGPVFTRCANIFINFLT